MKRSIILFLRTYLSFVVVFGLWKVIFMGFYYDIYRNYPWGAWLKVWAHGLPLDLSVGGYFMLLPGLWLAASPWLGQRIFSACGRGYFVLVGILLGTIYVGDLALYQYWGFRLDSTPLFYLASPKEAFASVSTGQLLGGIIAWILIIALFYLWFKKFVLNSIIRKDWAYEPRGFAGKRILRTLVMVLFTGLLILPIRGGISVSTMNVGRVYFSKEMPLNHAAINPCFSLLESLLKDTDFSRQYRYMPDAEAAAVFARMADQPAREELPSLFTVKRPNVVFVLLESFMSSVVEQLGGEPGVTPHLNAWSQEGVLFTNLYASSVRTDRGIVSILSGYPAQPTTSVMKYPQKSQTLPSIPRSLGEAGYTTRYYYGGDANFTNMRSYLVGQGISDIIDQADFPLSYQTTKWGVPDQFLFQRAEEDLAREQQEPFFNVIQTSSSHEPFKVPSQHFSDPYRNSVYYADSCLNAYLVTLRESPYWKNTVVVLVADHHYGGAQDASCDEVERRRIPTLWVGGAVRAPRKVDAYASQIDLAATLLYQLDLPHEEFRFSKNLLNPSSPHFAFFSYPDCIGLVTSDSTYLQDNAADQVLLRRKTLASPTSLPVDSLSGAPDVNDIGVAARAYLQTLYDDLGAR